MQNPLLRILHNDKRRALLFLILSLILYGASTRPIGVLGHVPQSKATHYAYLAESFLKGRSDLDVSDDEARTLIELVPHAGKYYVVYPPMPAVLLMPFVFYFGKTFPTSALSILLAACSVALTYVLLRRYGIPIQVSN